MKQIIMEIKKNFKEDLSESTSDNGDLIGNSDRTNDGSIIDNDFFYETRVIKLNSISDRPAFGIWKNCYYTYLLTLYNLMHERAHQFKVSIDPHITFHRFCSFIYYNSSGYISEYL